MTAGTNTDFRHLIQAGSSTIVVSRQSNGVNSVYYLNSDHLGSSVVFNGTSPTVYTSYDAFGRRRSGSWSGGPSASEMSSIAGVTREGYTGQTMLDNLELIHMNGRVQDPVIGRFISADPLITEPMNTQGYNRYSYVENNPLSLTDPSGFTDNASGPSCTSDKDGIVKCSGSSGDSAGCLGCTTSSPLEPGDTIAQSMEDYYKKSYASIIVGSLARAGRAAEILAPCLRNQYTFAACAIGVGAVAGVILAQQSTAGRLLAAQGDEREIVGRDLRAAYLSLVRARGRGLFWHGTNKVITLAIAAGAPLSVDAATAASRGEQDIGFYMTPDFDVANYFAARTGDPGILQLNMTPEAVETLMQNGGVIRDMQPGGLRVQALEFYLPPSAFGAFNALRVEGEITVLPHLPPGSN